MGVMPGAGEFAGLAAAVCWGVTSLIVRQQARAANVVVLNAMTITLTAGGTLVSLLVLGLLGWHAPTFGPRPLLGVALLGISVAFSLVAGDTLYFLALQRIGVARAMPLSMGEPLLTTLLAVALLGERISPGLVAGSVLIPSGLYLVTRPSRGRLVVPAVQRRTQRLGIAMALGAAVCWALSTIWLRPGLDQVDVLTASFLKTAFGAALLWPIAWRSALWLPRSGTGRPAWRMVVLAGACSGVSTYLFTFAVQQVGAARAATLSATSPLFAVPLSALLLGEHVSALMLAGTLLTLVGVALVLGS
jgi:drug/metabolite transporter (DMT)-like permease